MTFPFEHGKILERMENIDPEKYVRTRNFINGSVTYLSPHISRGVISTKQVFQSLIEREFDLSKIEKFVMKLAQNISDVHLFVGEFDELISRYSPPKIHFKEHPTTTHFTGIKEERDWMFPVHGYFPSFFAFWKKCKKHIV